MKTHAVIDTNVIISALISTKSDSATVQVLDKLFDEEIIPLYNQEILKEYREVMNRPKFQIAQSDVELVIKSITESGIEIDAVYSDVVLTDPKDQVFYDVFLSFPDSYLITGNLKHFPTNDHIINPAGLISLMTQ